jgi:hypothetical protein
MIDVHDDVWLDVLAGRVIPTQLPDQSRAIALEAAALREFIRQQEEVAYLDSPMIDAEREVELVARARREGLLVSRAAGARTRLGARQFGLAAAAVLVVAVGVGVWRASLSPSAVVRGVDHGTVYLEARDPTALKRQLTEELSAAGVKVSVYERLGRLGIDADLPQPLPTEVAEILERHHIPIPSDGALVVEIEARTPQ